MATSSPIRLRLVGGALRRYRENLSYTLEQSAAVLECDRSKLSRIETGVRGIRPKELRELLTEYGVPDAEQETLQHLARRGDRPAWLQEYTAVLPGEAAEYYGLEPPAAEIMIYDAHAVPSLLRTPQYARVIAETGLGSPPGDHAERAVSAVEERQHLLLDGNRQVSVVLGEAAVRQQVGGPEVMAVQLDYLAGLAAANPAVTVQVLPFTAGAHAASGCTSFSLLRFGGDLAVVFVPGLGGRGSFAGEHCEVASYLRAFTQLRAGALTVSGTVSLLQEAAGPPWD